MLSCTNVLEPAMQHCPMLVIAASLAKSTTSSTVKKSKPRCVLIHCQTCESGHFYYVATCLQRSFYSVPWTGYARQVWSYQASKGLSGLSTSLGGQCWCRLQVLCSKNMHTRYKPCTLYASISIPKVKITGKQTDRQIALEQYALIITLGVWKV